MDRSQLVRSKRTRRVSRYPRAVPTVLLPAQKRIRAEEERVPVGEERIRVVNRCLRAMPVELQLPA